MALIFPGALIVFTISSFEFQQVRSVFYPSSQHLGEIMKVGGDIWRARSASLLWGLGVEPSAGSMGRAPGGGQEANPLEAESLVACGRPMETAKLPHSLYFANSLHIGLLCIFNVFRKTITTTFEVASMSNVPYCHSRQKVSEFYHYLGHAPHPSDVAASRAVFVRFSLAGGSEFRQTVTHRVTTACKQDA